VVKLLNSRVPILNRISLTISDALLSPHSKIREQARRKIYWYDVIRPDKKPEDFDSKQFMFKRIILNVEYGGR